MPPSKLKPVDLPPASPLNGELKRRGAKPGVRPDVHGVPGELAPLPSDLLFGSRLRQSPYDGLLQQLKAATLAWKDTEPCVGAQPGLVFGEMRARTSLAVRAKKLGLRISFAEKGAKLYVRLDGVEGDQTRHIRHARIVAALTNAPHSLAAITKKLRERGDTLVDMQMTEAILGGMAKTGEVIRRESAPGLPATYALNPSYRPQ